MLHKKTQDIPAFAGMSCSTHVSLLYCFLFYFHVHFICLSCCTKFYCDRCFSFLQAFDRSFLRILSLLFLLDVVNFKISGSKYPFFSFLEMYTLVCSFVVFPFWIVTLLVFALIFVILDALYVTAFLPDALIVALAS